jgi:hypothetical protein
LQGLWGYGKEQYNLTFKNREYSVSLGYPDRINYMIYGYGLIETMQSGQSTIRNERHKGIALNYFTNLKKIQVGATLGYKKWNDNNSYVTTNSITNNLIGTFILDEVKANFLFSHTGTKHLQQLSMKAVSETGKDEQVLYKSTNYKYNHQLMDAEYLIRLHHQRKTSIEFGASIYYDKLAKQDIVSAHDVKNTTIEPGLSAALYLKGQNKDLFSIILEGGYLLPLNGSISVPSLQETVFTRGVVYPNFNYASSEALRVLGKLNYISASLFKEFKTGFSMQASYLNATQLNQQFSSATFSPSKHRLNLNLAINLYF